MDKDRDMIRGLYDKVIEEQITPLAVQKNATGDGETGGLTPDELPADTASTTEVQKGTGAENAKGVDSPEEAEEKLSPVKADKGTKKTAKKKEVTAIKDSVEPKKSFMDLFDQVMIKEEGEIEDPAYDDEAGDFPEPEEEEEVPTEMDEGEIYSKLADLFGQLAEVKGYGAEDMGAEAPVEDEMGGIAPESVDADGNPIEEMKSEPEPKELVADAEERMVPTKLAGKGVVKGATKKAAIKGNDKKRTGELEDGPEGLKHDKSKFAVKGEGPAHKAKNASFLES